MRFKGINTNLLLILLLTFFIMSVKAVAAPAGRVVWVKGNFIAVGPNKAQRSLERAGIFYEGDTLVTNSASQAQVVFADNALMTFREGTTFRVDQYKFNAGGGKSIVSLAEGGFRTVTGAIAARQPSNYQVRTPVATIGVRGTEFIVYYKNGRLYVGRISGRPCVYDKIKRIQICLTEQMPYVVIIAGEGSSVSTDMPSELSDSDDLQIVSAMIQPSNSNGPGGPGGQVSSFCVQ